MAAHAMKQGKDVVFTPEREKAGADILAVTDFIGFNATGAAWVWTASSDHWHFLLISHMIDSKGPTWVYEHLLHVFKRHTLPENITPLDLMIASPRETTSLTSAFRKGNGGGVLTLTDMTVNGLDIDFVAMYRMQPLPTDAGARTKAFERRVTELMAA